MQLNFVAKPEKYEYILTWKEYQMEYIWGCFQAMVFMKRRDWAESLYYNYKNIFFYIMSTVRQQFPFAAGVPTGISLLPPDADAV